MKTRKPRKPKPTAPPAAERPGAWTERPRAVPVPIAPAVTAPAAREIAVYRRLGISLVSGRGAIVVDTDGREYLDFYGGHAAALLGQGHPRLLAALAEQSQRLIFQTNLVELPVRDAAIARLGAYIGSGPAAGLDRVFLVNSGAEAIDNALRLAFRATARAGAPRGTVVALSGGFHGRTAAAAAITDGSARWNAFPREPFAVRRVPIDDAAALAAAVDRNVAAVVIEPVQGLAGAREVPAAMLRAARAACDRHGALWISDEIQCGMGRTGEPCAAAAAGVRPDIVTLAKGIAGGFPAAALLTTAEIAAAVGDGDLGTTFGGGPLASALIAAVIDAIESERLLARARALESRIRWSCIVGPVRRIEGRGLLLGLRTRPRAAEVLAELRDRGILAGGAADPHIVRLMPPLVLPDEAVDRLARALEEVSP
jgi:acetylornithine/succinyldiaminopimelate/putrescine aminotransferase